MIAIVWQVEIRPGRETEFEEFYGADGDWTASRHSRRISAAHSFAIRGSSSRYLVIEYWSEMLVQHKAYQHDTIQQLTARQDALVRAPHAR